MNRKTREVWYDRLVLVGIWAIVIVEVIRCLATSCR